MKRINEFTVITIIAVTLSLLFYGCGSTVNENELQTFSDTSNTHNAYDSDNGTKLSDECDFLLSIGIDDLGNTYELVANTAETFDDTNKIGVIKNNEWYMEPTNDCPFIDENGRIMGVIAGYDQHDYYIYDGTDCEYVYIGNDCFAYSEGLIDCNILWNTRTKASHSFRFGEYSTKYVLNIVVKNDGENDYLQNNLDSEYVLFLDDKGYEWEYKLLDTNTMTFDSEFTDIGYDKYGVYPYSEDLFFAETENGQFGFFDKSGNLIIDFAEYSDSFNLGTPTPRYFQNGTFKFNYPNSAGVFFEITMDKQGNIISEVSEMETKD